MRKRAWVAWMLIIAMMITLWPASVGYALERPVVYPEMNDGYQSKYTGETEQVRVYDNGEKKKVDVMIVPVDEVQALVWHPVSGASYYLYSIRDVDNDEPVIVNEQTTNYWITLEDMLDWDGPLEYGVTYKIAAAACTSPDDCYWSSEPFYFQLVETVQPEETATPEPEVKFSGSFDQKRIELTVGDVTTVSGRVRVEGDTLNRVTYQIDGWDGDDGNNRYCSQELWGQVGVELSQMNQLVLDTTREPLNAPGEYTLRLVASVESGEWEKLASMTVVVKAKDEPATPEPQTVLSGAFASDYIELNIGDVTTVGGSVSCTGSTLNRVTYQIEGWDGNDGNNRYCTQEVQNVASVDLSQMNQLVLDTNREPLNVPGEYKLWVVASAADGVWNHLSSMTVVVKGTDGPTHSVTDEPATPPPATPEPQTVLSGAFASDYIELNIGDVTTVGGMAYCIGSTLNRVTYQIEGWDGNDGNNRYCTQEVQNVTSVDLSQMNQLVLDTNREPLNVPGEYKLWVVASAADGVWNHLASMTVVVKAAGEPTHSVTVAPVTPAPTTEPPATQVELKADIMNSSIAVKLGDTACIEGWVTCKGGQLDRVTYLITDHPVEGDENNRQYSAKLGNVSELDLADADELILDTNRTPLNVPGDYQIEVYARAVGMENGMRLANVQVHVYAEESGVTVVPMTEVELKADVMDKDIKVKLGEKARIEGWVTCKGGLLERVTYLITDHPVEGDENNRQYSKTLGNVSELDLAEAEELILDTNRAPLNVPGDYQIEVYAKAVGMERGKRLVNVQVHVEAQNQPVPDEPAKIKTVAFSGLDPMLGTVYEEKADGEWVTIAVACNVSTNIVEAYVGSKYVEMNKDNAECRLSEDGNSRIFPLKLKLGGDNSSYAGDYNVVVNAFRIPWDSNAKDGNIEDTQQYGTLKISHVMTETSEDGGTNYRSDREQHTLTHTTVYKSVCSICGYTATREEKAQIGNAENHTWGTDGVCTVCGYKKNDLQENSNVAINSDGRMSVNGRVANIVTPHYYLNAGETPESADDLKKIIRQFDVEKNYTPAGSTYCNYFATDVALAAGAFLPGKGIYVCRNCYDVTAIPKECVEWRKIIDENNLWCSCGDSLSKGVAMTADEKSGWNEVGKENYADLTRWLIEKGHMFGWKIINEKQMNEYPQKNDWNAGVTDSATMQKVIDYVNDGYLVVGVRTDWDKSKNNSSGHAFIGYPHPSDTSRLYTAQAGGTFTGENGTTLKVNREDKPDGGATRASNNGWNLYFVYKGFNNN